MCQIFFSLSGELKLRINSSEHSTYQLFVFVFTKSDLSLILDFISLFQTQMLQPGFAVVFSLDCWKKSSLSWIKLPSPKHSAVKKKGKKMKTALRFYCPTTKNALCHTLHCLTLTAAFPLIHCWSAWPSRTPVLHGCQLFLSSPISLILTPCHKVIIVLAWPQHLSYINNSHLFALQGMTELKIYLDWRDSLGIRWPWQVTFPWLLENRHKHDLGWCSVAYWRKTQQWPHLSPVPAASAPGDALLQLPACNKTRQTWPAFLRPQDSSHHTAAPELLNLDHKTTRHTQGKQEDVQETPAVSHASSAENVPPQLLLWAPPFHRITKHSELESDHRVQLLALHTVPREYHRVPENVVQKVCELAVLGPWPLPWGVYSSARPPSAWKTFPYNPT